MVVPCVLVITEPHSGIAVSARPFSSCGRLSHDGRNIVHCYMCYRCVPFDTPCPWYSSNHGHERGNFELDWFLLLELRLCT